MVVLICLKSTAQGKQNMTFGTGFKNQLTQIQYLSQSETNFQTLFKYSCLKTSIFTSLRDSSFKHKFCLFEVLKCLVLQCKTRFLVPLRGH